MTPRRGTGAQGPDPPSSGLICVVDDDPPVRLAMANLLQSAGYESVCFESAEECLVPLRLSGVDFGVFDVKLGGMSGFALQERLAALQLNIPLVFVSGHADSAMEQWAREAGAIALLRKPIDVDLLLSLIEDALAGRDSLP